MQFGSPEPSFPVLKNKEEAANRLPPLGLASSTRSRTGQVAICLLDIDRRFSRGGNILSPRRLELGLGLLGHLDKGGHFEVRQAEVVPGHWDLTTMSVEITGKALLFATIGMRKKETHGDFYQVSDDLTLAEAADMLNRKLVVADSP